MIQKACNHCKRFSEQVTAGYNCPWCGNKNSVLDQIWPWLLGGVLMGSIAVAAGYLI